VNLMMFQLRFTAATYSVTIDMKVLVTGAAGFIGMHVAQRLLAREDVVVGIDNINDYYNTALKHARLAQLSLFANFKFELVDIADRFAMEILFEREKFDRVIHLAAQAGVRYSLQNPHSYVDSNLVGFLNVLEGCRNNCVQHLVYASSSSVYGGNTKIPFAENDNVDHPVSLYAATKKANELMAHSYSHLYKLPTTGLRFFTVYGPWGRPDMSPWLFTSAIIEGRAIDVFNMGKMQRDFTYIDDIAEGTLKVLDLIPKAKSNYGANSSDSTFNPTPYKIYNIGNNSPIQLMDFIETIEKALNRQAKKNYLPMQSGDVVTTFADISALKDETGFEPKIDLAEGISRWVNWYLATQNNK
jgi:UDP-glucuronate 4-epimerase